MPFAATALVARVIQTAVKFLGSPSLERRAGGRPRGEGTAEANGTRLEESVTHFNAASISRYAPSFPRANRIHGVRYHEV